MNRLRNKKSYQTNYQPYTRNNVEPVNLIIAVYYNFDNPHDNSADGDKKLVAQHVINGVLFIIIF